MKLYPNCCHCGTQHNHLSEEAYQDFRNGLQLFSLVCQNPECDKDFHARLVCESKDIYKDINRSIVYSSLKPNPNL